MTEHAVVIAGAGPTGLMLAGELGVGGGRRRDCRTAPLPRNSSVRARAACTHAPSRSSISVESPSGF